MDNLAFVNSNPNGFAIHHFAEIPVLRLGVSVPGTYIVIARVVIRNDDSDFQDATARIALRDGSDFSDTVRVRIPGEASYSFYLQGTLRVGAGHEMLDVRCGTYKGYADQSSLFALQVSDLRFQ